MSETPRGELGTVMESRELHVLSALDPSDPSTVMSLVHRARVYKHFLTKILRCWYPNPVQYSSTAVKPIRYGVGVEFPGDRKLLPF